MSQDVTLNINFRGQEDIRAGAGSGGGAPSAVNALQGTRLHQQKVEEQARVELMDRMKSVAQQTRDAGTRVSAAAPGIMREALVGDPRAVVSAIAAAEPTGLAQFGLSPVRALQRFSDELINQLADVSPEISMALAEEEMASFERRFRLAQRIEDPLAQSIREQTQARTRTMEAQAGAFEAAATAGMALTTAEMQAIVPILQNISEVIQPSLERITGLLEIIARGLAEGDSTPELLRKTMQHLYGGRRGEEGEEDEDGGFLGNPIWQFLFSQNGPPSKVVMHG